MGLSTETPFGRPQEQRFIEAECTKCHGIVRYDARWIGAVRCGCGQEFTPTGPKLVER